MLITNDFVMLNFPKTGTTFTRSVVKNLYGDGAKEILGFNPMNPDSKNNSPHLSFSQMPTEYIGLPVASIYRNIFDRYVSLFNFKWWKDNSTFNLKVAASSIYPNFPDLNFLEYLGMLEQVQKPRILNHIGVPETTSIGFQTIQFIIFYAKNPRDCLLCAIKNPEIDLRNYLPKINFLRQAKLRTDLSNFLSTASIAEDASKLIENTPDINVSRPENQKDWQKYWEPDLLAEYKKREHILIRYIADSALEEPAAIQT